MIGSAILRKTINSLIAKRHGSREYQPRLLSAQVFGGADDSTIAALPVRPLKSPQILDPGNPRFGKWEFMLGYDEVGGSIALGGNVPVAEA